MQLDLTLRSFLMHCFDHAGFPLVIIYRATSPIHAGQYAVLQKEYAGSPNVIFLPERNFWFDFMSQLALHAGLAERATPYLRELRLGWRFSRWRRRWLSYLPERFILFLVDDNIFVKDFTLQHAIRALESNPAALGFSLRLGANTNFCYTAGRSQALPAFLPEDRGFLRFNWTGGDLDFGYPLEVSSSVYRMADLLPSIDGWSFSNPNELESRLSDHASQFRHLPELLCFHQSVTFCNPINRVNRTYQNRAGDLYPLSSELLSARFAAGERADPQAYTGFVPNGCHQEVPLIMRRMPGEKLHGFNAAGNAGKP